MSGNGTAAFANSSDYQVGVTFAHANFIVTGAGEFKARLTWLDLHDVQVFRGRENLPRIGYFVLPPGRVFVSFPTGASSFISGGLELQAGDLEFHGRGERTHQRTPGGSQWGFISLLPEQLGASGKEVTGLEMTSPTASRVLRPPRSAATRLLRLHSKACRLAETNLKLIGHRAVAQALRQQLLHALVSCLTADDANGSRETRQHHASILARFEDELVGHTGHQLIMPRLCAAIGVPERTLRHCCAEFLGMSPTRYFLLRRLNLARGALQRADPAKANVADIARAFQFLELGRFAVSYRTVFGEMPSTTLRRHPSSLRDRISAEAA